MDKSIIGLFLPEGILEYFDIGSITQSNDAYQITLDEKNLRPEEFAGQRLISKGFTEVATISDFPIRGKACYLKVRRRRWQSEDMSKIVLRDWEMVAKGTRMTKEFASFLKEVHRYNASKL